MGRTSEFDAAQTLERAMEVFWAKGYGDTSMDDLVNATGVSRYGIYGTFGNKRELFLAALDRYAQMTAGLVQRQLRQPDAALPQIQGYFQDVIRMSHAKWIELGCMICNTAIEVAPQDPEIASVVQGYLINQSAAFGKALKNAKAKGQLPANLDHRANGLFLTGVLMGLVVFARAGMDKKTMRGYVDTVVASLEQH